MGWFGFTFAALLAVGMLAAAYFVFTYRPAQRWGLLALDAMLWVPAVLALLLLAAWRYLTDQVRPKGWREAAAFLAVFGFIDLALIVRVLHWRRVRRVAREAEEDGVRYIGPDRRRRLGA